MSKQIVPQEETKVKDIEFIVIVADEPPPPPRACTSCGAMFVPEDDTHVVCPDCEALGIRCGCVFGESCPICDAVAAVVYGGDELPF